MKNNKFYKKNIGFTLLEMLIAFAIIGIISVIVFNSFSKERKKNDLIGFTGDAVSLIRQAQAKTLYSENNSQYGIHLDSNFIVLFAGTVYDDEEESNQILQVPNSFEIIDIDLENNSDEIIFERLTGDTNGYGSFIISNGDNLSSTINISQTGLISSDL